MDQNSKIHYYNNQYNSMFDDSESEEEIKDLANDSYNKLFKLTEKENPELFKCIIKMMNNNNILHKNDDYLTFNELNKINSIYYNKNYEATLAPNYINFSYFVNFNPKNSDFSIIFKYLRNILILNDYCFAGCKNLIKINLPNSVTKIGDYCFNWCKNLTKINIPDSVTEIGEFCFDGCKKLVEVNIPNSISKLQRGCFNTCIKLTKINIPNSVTEIDNFCFDCCSNLKEINLPTSVIRIGDNCFGNCKSLKEITIPNSVTEIGDECFYRCTKIKKIIIPKRFKNKIKNIFSEINLSKVKIIYF